MSENNPQLGFVDISAQVYGKYQNCTMAKDGMWYADSDFDRGFGFGNPIKGALPAPRQDTPELTAKAKAMHQAAAMRAVQAALPKSALWPWWKRLFTTKS